MNLSAKRFLSKFPISICNPSDCV